MTVKSVAFPDPLSGDHRRTPSRDRKERFPGHAATSSRPNRRVAAGSPIARRSLTRWTSLLLSVSSVFAQAYTRSEHQYTVPSVRLLDSTGAVVKLDTALAAPGPVMLQFIFTSCTAICPILSATFAASQDKLGPGARLVSITIDPEYDTPARLAEYAARFHSGRQWSFLTGSRQEIVAVQRAFGVDENGKMNHRPLTFLRAAPGTPWVRIEGLTSAADLVGEYRRVTAH